MLTEDGQNPQTQLLAGVLNSSLDGIVAFRSLRDDTGAITDFVFEVINSSAEKLVGRRGKDLLGKQMLQTLPGNKTDGLFDAYVRVVQSGEPFIAEHHYAHDGLDAWFRISATKCGDGFTVCFADITKSKIADTELSNSAERLAEAQKLARIGNWQWTPSDNQIIWSDMTKQIFDVPLDQPAPDFDAHKKQIHPDDVALWESVVARALEDHQPYVMTFRTVLPDGSIRVIEGRGRCELGPNGEVTRVFGTAQDITEQEQVRQEIENHRERLVFALNTSRSGLWDWDVTTGETYFSDSWYTMLGYEPGEMPMQLQSWVDITEPEDLKRATAAIEAYFRGETPQYSCEIRVKNKQGQWQWVNDIGQAVERDASGKVTRMVGLHLDIHAQKIAQFELAEARDIAQQASASKSAFVANMSHEIRTPMNAILGYADLILDADQNASDKRNHAQTIRRNGKHLLSILNDVLDISKIEAGKMSIEKVDCNPDQLFADVITLMMPKAIQKGIDLDFVAVNPLPQRIKTDPTRLKQIVLNLVGNAIKFTSKGEVKVSVQSRPAEDGEIELLCDVSDTGIGINPQQIQRLFNPFSQADESTTRKYGGTGLGLTISLNLCELLGGELTCNSTPGQGSTFSAKILVGQGEKDNKPKATFRHLAGADTQPLAGKRVLVVEDGKDNQRLIKHYLAKSGAAVEVADNGQIGKDAVLNAVANDAPFDMVLMDMQMPVLDGYDATAQLREAGYELPIIALTAHASANDRRVCLEAGCTDYLSKPVDRHQLIRLITDHINARVKQDAGI